MNIQVEKQDGIAVVKLNRGIPNPLDLEMVVGLAGIIRKLKDDPENIGLVLGSANEKIFSLGFDLPGLYDLPRDDFRHFYHSFNQACLELYTFPKPTVAAIEGHAIAGGCVLALCCDYRVIAKGRTLMGLNEVKLGVPVPFLADLILHQVIGDRSAREMIDKGEFYTSDMLLEMGMVDQVLPAGQVVQGSMKRMQDLGSTSLPEYYAQAKKSRVGPMAGQFEQERAEKEQSFVEHWYSQESRDLLQQAMEKF